MADEPVHTLDRAAHLRTRDGEIADLLADERCLLLPVWRNRNLVHTGGDETTPAFVERKGAAKLLDLATDPVFLGMLGERPCFAITLPGGHQAPQHKALAGAGEFNDLRLAGVNMATKDTELLAYARGILYWHRHNHSCSECGGETHAAEAGHCRVCNVCDKRSFPRTDPAVMALIVHDDRCLLARQASFPPGMFSILAGFVEPGEDLEQAVIREVREEVGLEVCDLRYVRSQPWPFPSSLMIGFAMRALSDQFDLDDDELEEARWFSREQIRSPEGFYVPPAYSLAGQLIGMFLEDALPAHQG